MDKIRENSAVCWLLICYVVYGFKKAYSTSRRFRLSPVYFVRMTAESLKMALNPSSLSSSHSWPIGAFWLQLYTHDAWSHLTQLNTPSYDTGFNFYLYKACCPYPLHHPINMWFPGPSGLVNVVFQYFFWEGVGLKYRLWKFWWKHVYHHLPSQRPGHK